MRSARTCALCCRRFFSHCSLRTRLRVMLAPRVSWAAISSRICSIDSTLICGRGFMPDALRRFSEVSRFDSRCVAAHFSQRVWPCMAARPQLHRPCFLRSCRERAGCRLRVDGWDLGARVAFFGLVRVDFRRGADFVRLWDCLGINMVSVKSCGFVVRTPVHAGRMTVGSVVRVVSGGHSPRSWRSWFCSSCNLASAWMRAWRSSSRAWRSDSNVAMCRPVLGSYQPSWPSAQRRLRLRMAL